MYQGKPKSWLSKMTITSCVFLTFLAIGFTASAMPAMPVPEDVHKKLFGLAIGTAVGLVGDQLTSPSPSVPQVAGLVFLLGVLPFLYVPEEDPVITLDRELSRQLSRSRHPSITSTNSRRLRHTEEDFVDETEEVKRIFRPLQLLTACFGALSHGSNDVGNCIGPLVTVWYIFQVRPARPPSLLHPPRLPSTTRPRPPCTECSSGAGWGSPWAWSAAAAGS